MTTILLTVVVFAAAAFLYPLAVIVIAAVWPWLVERMARPRLPNQFNHGVVMVAATAVGLYAHGHVFGAPAVHLGGGIIWFIAITLEILAYGLSAIILGIRLQSRESRTLR